MLIEKVDLYGYFNLERKKKSGGFLAAYVPSKRDDIEKPRPTMLVIAGGAYKMLSDRESEPVALAYMKEGFNSFVLEYSVNTAYPTPLLEACMAVAYIRENAEKYRVDKTKIAVVGFSAGGHLAAMLGNIYGEKEITDILGAANTRPDALILSYPVATLGEFTHEETCKIITGGREELRGKLSPDRRVTKDSAPAFIWHTATDDAVPVENSVALAQAYRRAGVRFALHIFEKGWHGLSLCTPEVLNQMDAEEFASVGKWFSLSLDWLKSLGF